MAIFQFLTLDVSAETLFSLLHGDDIFATFATIDKRFGYAIFIYSRFYLYVFIVTFIYLVSNLFTAIILDAYETIKVSTVEPLEVTNLYAAGS